MVDYDDIFEYLKFI